jgi:hypothetical protein
MKKKCFLMAMLSLVLAFGTLIGSCSMDDASSSMGPVNDPSAGIMTEDVAGKIFVYSVVTGGVSIDRFKDADELRAYLSGARTVVPTTGVFTISKIGGLAVAAIGDGAFDPSKGAQNLKDAGVSIISLPETIRAIAANAFNGAESVKGGKITLKIPPSVYDNLPDEVKSGLESDTTLGTSLRFTDIPADVQGSYILARMYDRDGARTTTIAVAKGQISGGSVTLALKNVVLNSATNEDILQDSDWSGSGEINMWVFVLSADPGDTFNFLNLNLEQNKVVTKTLSTTITDIPFSEIAVNKHGIEGTNNWPDAGNNNEYFIISEDGLAIAINIFRRGNGDGTLKANIFEFQGTRTPGLTSGQLADPLTGTWRNIGDDEEYLIFTGTNKMTRRSQRHPTLTYTYTLKDLSRLSGTDSVEGRLQLTPP